MIWLPETAASILNNITGIFNQREKNKALNDVIKERNKLKKACNVAEIIIGLCYKNKKLFNDEDKKIFSNLVKDFNKLD